MIRLAVSDINATDDVDDPEHLDIKITAASSAYICATALTYARCRYTYADGDYTRMRHQRQVLGALANQILNNFDATKIFGLVNSSDMLVTDMSVQDIVATVNAMRGMNVDGILLVNPSSYADDRNKIDGVSCLCLRGRAQGNDGARRCRQGSQGSQTPWVFPTVPALRSATRTTTRLTTTQTALQPTGQPNDLMTQAIRAIRTTTKSPPATATATKPIIRATRAYQPA